MSTQSVWKLLIEIVKKLHNERTRRILAEKEVERLSQELTMRDTQLTALAVRHQLLCNENDKLNAQLAQETGAEK